MLALRSMSHWSCAALRMRPVRIVRCQHGAASNAVAQLHVLATYQDTAQRLTGTAAQVPWEDLRYLFGEILYGGHIVEDWDRRLSPAPT